jgi:hypothetical protein
MVLNYLDCNEGLNITGNAPAAKGAKLMSVIGRLDEQVDAILIAPLKKRGERKEETEAATDTQTPDRAEPSAPKQQSVPGRVGKSSEHRQREADTLPVWLL